MTGEEIKAMRRALAMSAGELAKALDVEAAIVHAWEREELFPTKKHVGAMRALLEKAGGAGEASEGQGSDGEAPASAFAALADPAVWRLLRKIVAHAELRAEVEQLAERYRDPAEGSPGESDIRGRGRAWPSEPSEQPGRGPCSE